MQKSKPKYLFAGLGTMGFAMAGHLSKNTNLDIYVFNRTSSVSAKWVKKHSGTQLIALNNCSVKFDGVITCLKDDAAISSVLLESGLLELLKNNSVIVDHSTTSLDLVSSISQHPKILEKKISFFDAPVSGGEAGAVNGALSIMLGGPKKKLVQINNLMQSYAKNIVHIGPSGHGQLSKMVNQLCIGSLIQGLSEGVTLGKKSNLNMTKVLDAIAGGAAQSWQMDNRFETMVNDEFDFGFAVDLMIKDLKIAIDHSKDIGIELPSTKSVLQNYKKLSTLGDGGLDTSSLIKLLEK
ncbi:NAD(P)-dependent oxidoreductase [Gammaproteobacteria bacterium]|nr:NAD(P)-dependent oxidoreductase [Gammaproteobacteria bacterium]MDB9815581.1 NAD(P)-dependent oxidoreductase [Gammaproteobacteria bacterium]MDB9860150.1 NAD(P)-dependent oxidoreductase [Gammaproteobacteria bacterium]MDB9939679.1 NAD(P)-dependent oxidoreductase [Gammaproteobacteria bacterium]